MRRSVGPPALGHLDLTRVVAGSEGQVLDAVRTGLDVAHRVLERAAAIGDFTTITPDRGRQLAAKYDLNYLVTEGRLDLPVAYENSQFRIYALK